MTSDRSKWFAVLGAVVGGAIGGVVFWYVLHNGVVINGRGLLARAPWPLNTFVPFAVAGAVFATISVIRSNRRAQSLRSELPQVAGELGLAYDEGDVEIAPEARPKKLLVMGDWGRCQNRMSGTSDDVPAQMFDLTTVSRGTEDTTTSHWTAVLFQKTHLPAFACIPKSWSTFGERSLMPSVSFDPEVGDPMARQAVAEFEKAYQLSVPEMSLRSDEDEVRQLFLAPRLEALARQPGWHVQSADGCLLLLRSGTAPAAARPTIWREAIELRRALLAPVSSGLMSIPPAPGMERDRQRNRQSGRRWGGLAGAVVGFFGSFIAFGAVMFSRRPGPGPGPFIFAFFPVVLGGLVVGAVAGTRLGGWLADRGYRPTPDGAPAPRINRGWVFAGAMAGWVLGGAIGMGLTALFTRQIEARWVMPITFFTPGLLCLVLGGFAGYRVARGRASRRSGG